MLQKPGAISVMSFAHLKTLMLPRNRLDVLRGSRSPVLNHKILRLWEHGVTTDRSLLAAWPWLRLAVFLHFSIMLFY